jgi:enamine deaminase RidA (YjgF/YER057c/UK114 family)
MGDITAQTKHAMDNAATILKEAGMSTTDVVSSCVYLADATTFQAMNATYCTYFPSSPPARATVNATPTNADQIIEVTMVAVTDPGRKAIVPPNADGSPGRVSPNLSSAIQVGTQLYIAGMSGGTPTNKGDVKAQTVESLVRIGRALNAAGFDWSDVVEGTVFLPELTRMEEMNARYREVVAKNFPARVTVGTPLMGDAMVEIMLTAVK